MTSYLRILIFHWSLRTHNRTELSGGEHNCHPGAVLCGICCYGRKATKEQDPKWLILDAAVNLPRSFVPSKYWNTIRFHGTRINVTLLTPVRKHVLPNTNFQETHKLQMSLRLDCLYWNSTKSDNNCLKQGHKFIYIQKQCMASAAPIFTKITTTL